MNEMVWPSLISNKFLAPAFFNWFWFWLSLYNLKPMASLSDKLTKLIPGYHFHHFLTIWSKNTHTCPRSTIEDDNRVKSKILKSLFDRNISVRDLWWENLWHYFPFFNLNFGIVNENCCDWTQFINLFLEAVLRTIKEAKVNFDKNNMSIYM